MKQVYTKPKYFIGDVFIRPGLLYTCHQDVIMEAQYLVGHGWAYKFGMLPTYFPEDEIEDQMTLIRRGTNNV